MTSDTRKALACVLAYLRDRPVIIDALLTYANTGVRAQSLEQTRSTGLSIERTDDEMSVPTISDPTGNASRPDQFRTLLDDLDRCERQLIGAANQLIGHPLVVGPHGLAQVLERYTGGFDPQVKAAAKTMRQALAHTLDGHTKDVAGRAADGTEGCASCKRLKVDGTPWWNPADYNGERPTDLGGGLTHKVKLCRPCQSFAVNQEPTRLPSVDELRHRHDDARGQWPKRYAVVR